ncbi:MAG: hypothetical protein K8R53_01905 [Bacteroidales bacterium]|nr:hypothetical protein [Bacteroidales bacterium]
MLKIVTLIFGLSGLLAGHSGLSGYEADNEVEYCESELDNGTTDYRTAQYPLNDTVQTVPDTKRVPTSQPAVPSDSLSKKVSPVKEIEDNTTTNYYKTTLQIIYRVIDYIF